MSMEQIKVTITIPESEYKTWNEFNEEGIDGVKFSIRSDISHRLRMDYIRDFDIEVEHETNI